MKDLKFPHQHSPESNEGHEIPRNQTQLAAKISPPSPLVGAGVVEFDRRSGHSLGTFIVPKSTFHPTNPLSFGAKKFSKKLEKFQKKILKIEKLEAEL